MKRMMLTVIVLMMFGMTSGGGMLTAGATGSRVQLRNQTQSPADDPQCSPYAADSGGVYYDCDSFGGQICYVHNDDSWSCNVRCTCYQYNSQGVCSSYGPPGCST